ncbi:MAG: quinone-dependent dihydroorotate dehydrogenase [Anaerolineales bacterium]
MYKHLRPLLFNLDPETAHHLTLRLLWIGGLQPFHAMLCALYSVPSKPVQAFGLTFKNPVGLAAGYDKDGIAVRGLSALGFGHIEIGTVTPRPQLGNPKPRVFRLVEDESVINRMGFPGKGMDFVSHQLLAASGRQSVVCGLNLGKNKDTPIEEAASDYIRLMKTFAPLADYLTINISSPNTVGLRRLQGREMLESLLDEIRRSRITNHWSTPILVKLAPDLTDEELDDALGAILDHGMDGVIATNTTVARPKLVSKHRGETGGLSGSPLRIQSEALLEKIVKRVDGRVPIVSVGGIMNPEDAKRRLDMGAALVQVYTGLIYRGPGLVREIVRAL